MEFFDWDTLMSFSGAALAVSVLTQLSKDIPLVRRVPTQLWSYLLSLIVLLAARYFTGGLSLASGALSLINAALISLASNGGYEAILRLKQRLTPAGD